MRPIWTEREWVVQRVIPRDVFYDHCLTAKEWATSQSTGKFNDLSGEEASRQYLTAKWSAMHSGMDADDVAEERVCYDQRPMLFCSFSRSATTARPSLCHGTASTSRWTKWISIKWPCWKAT